MDVRRSRARGQFLTNFKGTIGASLDRIYEMHGPKSGLQLLTHLGFVAVLATLFVNTIFLFRDLHVLPYKRILGLSSSFGLLSRRHVTVIHTFMTRATIVFLHCLRRIHSVSGATGGNDFAKVHGVRNWKFENWL